MLMLQSVIMQAAWGPGPAWQMTRMLTTVGILLLLALLVTARQHETHNPLERLKMASAMHTPDSSVQMAVSTTVLERDSEWIEVGDRMEHASMP